MPTPTQPHHHDPELQTEQHHLAESRAQLIRMRERTAGMDSSAAGDWVSREYLESTFQLRMRQLADDPTIPLFFGRIDYAPVVSRRSQSDRLEPRAEGPSSGHRLNPGPRTATTSGGGTSRTPTATRW